MLENPQHLKRKGFDSDEADSVERCLDRQLLGLRRRRPRGRGGTGQDRRQHDERPSAALRGWADGRLGWIQLGTEDGEVLARLRDSRAARRFDGEARDSGSGRETGPRSGGEARRAGNVAGQGEGRHASAGRAGGQGSGASDRSGSSAGGDREGQAGLHGRLQDLSPLIFVAGFPSHHGPGRALQARGQDHPTYFQLFRISYLLNQ